MLIWDDGVEATVAVGKITHGHFNPYDARLTAEQATEHVSADVIEFLDDLFADRILLWTSGDGRSGGWGPLGAETNPSLDPGDKTYVRTDPRKSPLQNGS